MKNLMSITVSLLIAVLVVVQPGMALGQDSVEGPLQLVVPLLEGSPAPFSGVLMPEADFRLAIEQDAAADRWEREATAFQTQLRVQESLYEAFIGEQRDRIIELSEQSWWDENGALFMFGVGTALGVVISALIVGLVTN